MPHLFVAGRIQAEFRTEAGAVWVPFARFGAVLGTAPYPSLPLLTMSRA